MSRDLQADDEVEKEIKSIRSLAQLEAAAVFAVFIVLVGTIDWVRGDSLRAFGQETAGFFLLVFFVWVAYSYYSEFSIRTKRINSKATSIERSLAEFRSNLEERLEAIEKRLSSEPNGSNGPVESSGLSEGLERLDKIEKEIHGRS